MLVRWNDLRREPFRVFFPLAVAFGCFGVGHWLAYALGWRHAYSGFYHASLQTGAYISCFIVGFLLTALPRFSATSQASSAELALALGLVITHAIGLWLRHWVVAEACFMGLLVLVAVFAGRRFARKAATVGPPTEFVWIPVALLLGLMGTGMMMLVQLGLAPPWWLGVGRPMASQGFLFGVVLGVGGFMAPRLMGREILLGTPRSRRRRALLHGLAGLAFFGSFWLEGVGAVSPAYLLRASVVTAVFAWTAQFYRPPAVQAGYVRLLWVSMWMVLLGLWAAGIVPRFRVGWLHLSFLGGLSLMTFAVGTMVCLSHAGQAKKLSEPLGALRVVALGIGGAVAARLIAEVQPAMFFSWLGVAAVSWLVAAVGWLGLVLPYCLRAVAPGAFEQIHEDAKRRLLKVSAEEP